MHKSLLFVVWHLLKYIINVMSVFEMMCTVQLDLNFTHASA